MIFSGLNYSYLIEILETILLRARKSEIKSVFKGHQQKNT